MVISGSGGDSACPLPTPPLRVAIVRYYLFISLGMDRLQIGFCRKNRDRFHHENQTLIDPDHIFNQDHDRDENF